MASARHAPASEQVGETQDILQELSTRLESGHTTDEACDQLLGQLYALTKSAHGPRLASSLRESDIALLGRYGFDGGRPESRHPALRCLNNVLVLAPSATKLFADAGLLEKATDLLKSTDVDDEFLAARLLLLCSAHAAARILPSLEHGGLAEAINANIARHAATTSLEPTPACVANIQLLSVLAAKHEAQVYRFFESLTPLLEIFDRAPVPSPPLQPPLSLLIDSLAVLPFHDEPLVAPGSPWPPFNEAKLVQILDLAVQAYKGGDLEPRITPLASLLSYIARDAPEDTKKRLRSHLLPSDQDRTQALGQGNSLPHRLVRISTGAVTPPLKKALAHMYLELSAGNPKDLIHNVGFGCGVGLLRALGMPVPPLDTDDGESAGGSSEVNPITGQRRDMEPRQTLPEMTGEEKEREAERLFVLFERLRATGLVDVENPVTAAATSGRIQELDSDADDD